jgi:hypothetical protein
VTDPAPPICTVDLDPRILSTPLRVQTRWHVITGAPSCGKTTLIRDLADRGFATVPETARRHMEAQLAQGRSIELTERGLLEPHPPGQGG